MKKNNDGWVDIRDEKLMINLGIHPRNYITPDFSKTQKEKNALRKAKHSCNKTSYHGGGVYTEASFPLYDKIIVYLKRNDNFKHQIYSNKIWMNQISSHIQKYVTKKGKNLVKYYIWNCKKYMPNELPVNPYRCNGKNK